MKSESTRLNSLVQSRIGIVLTICLLLASSSAIIFRAAAASSLASGGLMKALQGPEPEQEPNETAAQANQIAIPGGRTGSAKYGDAASYVFTYNNGPTDKIEDFFKFNIQAGQTRRLDISLTFTNPAADLDLFLFKIEANNTLTALAVSNGSTTLERLTPILTLGPGDYLIGVSAFDDPGNTASTNYTLNVVPDTAPPAPIINSISPVSAIAGGGPFSLTVNGRYFINGQSTVRWNGDPKTTAFINDTQLVAFLTAEEIKNAGTAVVTVFNPPTLGGPSSGVNFTILPAGAAELEVEPNETSAQANLLLSVGKRAGTVALGDAAQTIIQLPNGLTDPVEDMFAVNLAQNSRLDLILAGVNPNASLALYLLKETSNPTQLTMIGNSRLSGPQQRVTTPAMLSPGRYLVGVSAVTGSSDYIIESRVPGNRLLQVMASSAAPSSTVTVPISFYAEGDENTLTFSLSFNPAVLSNPQVSLGADDATGNLVVNNSQLAQGRVGVRLQLPQGQKFSAGVREAAKVNFAINAAAGVNSTTVDFTDQPVVRGMVDFNGNAVIGSYASGTVVVVPGFEADVSPRPNGNGDGQVTIADWTEVGRFVAGLDAPADGSEFQRADCAPRASLGDGRLTIADWVMAGRYAAGLETPVAAGGPTAAAISLLGAEKTASFAAPEDDQQARTLRVKEETFQRGVDNELKIELVSQGNENAIGFSVNFDVTQFNFVRAALGTDATGAILNVNTNRLSEGRIGIGLALPSGQTFATGVRQVVRITFNVPATSSVNTTTVSFGDLPIAREVVDASANVLTTVYAPGVITLNPPINLTPSLTNLNPGTVIVGGPSFTLTINGNNFVNGATVLVNGVARLTQFVSATQLTATILPQDIIETGTVSITVQNPAPGGGTSNALNLSIVNPVPTLSGVNPSSATVGGVAFTLMATGTNFVQGATVQFNGVNRVTTFVSATQLTAQIPATDIATAGTATVRVVNPTPGGGASNTVNFTINTPNPLPRITSINPDSIQAGSAAFTLTVTGTSFVSGSVVRFNGESLTTVFNSSTQLTANVPADKIATAGTASMTVFNPLPGGGTSNAALLTINAPPNPTPTLTALNPTAITAGGPAFTLTVAGTNFVSNSVVRFNGGERTTAFISATELRAQITAADIANGGTAAITVFNPAPGGGVSNALTLTITFAPPTITFLSPSSTVAGGPAFALTVVGTNFAPGSVVRWNGGDRVTTFVSVTELSAQITAADIQNIGTATVTVFSSPPGGGLSNSLTFTINQAARPLPRITSISPDKAQAGSAGFNLVVNGQNFVSDSVVRWNAAPRTTNFVSSTQLTAQIPAADIASIGTATVTVFTPPAGGGESNPITFTINSAPNPAPVATSINPATVNAGGPAFTLTVNGNNFVSTSVVQFNGGPRPTNFVSSTQLTAQISASDIAAAGAVSIRVFTPAPGGGTSAELTLTIVNAPPAITTLNPALVVEGSPAFMLTVTGTGFVIGSEIRVNGAARATTVVSATQLTTQITAAEVATAGTINIQVFNPPPGGGLSNTLTIEIRRRNPLPRITSISPEMVNAGGPGFTLVVNGTSFVNGAVVRVNGFDRPTDFVSETALAAQLTAADIANGGTLTITVFNPAPGGGNSNQATLTVNNPRPRITSLSPNSAVAGSIGFTMLVNGEGFVTSSVVQFNGLELPTTFVTSSQLSVQVPAAAITAGGSVPVVVVNPAPGGGVSSPVTFTITNPAAVITGLNPSQVNAGSGQFTLTVTGTGFVNGSVVKVNGQDRVTTFVSSTQLTAVIPAADIAVAGTLNVFVVNPAPGGGASNTVALTVLNPVPSITSLDPSTVTAGSPAFTLTINGVGFVQASVVQYNGAARTTTFVSANKLTIQITAADVASVGSANITVVNPTPGGGTSNTSVFTVNVQPNPVPLASSLSPSSIAAGSAGFTLTVNGGNFVPGSVVQWNGSARTTTFGNSTQLTAQITAADVASIGTAGVMVFNPAPGGGTSNALTFTITPPNPVPTLSSLNPNVAAVGSPAFTLTVNGTNFVSGSVVRWNGSPRTTTFVSATQLTAQVTAADVAVVGTASITVVNPAPGGGTSNALTFTISSQPNPVPTLTSIVPNSALEGDDPITLTVNGTNFVAASTVQWNGVPRQTVFVSSTQLTAQIPAADLANPGTANVTVVNPPPGGGTSNTLIFTINPLSVSCQTICFQSAQYFNLNPNRIPRGTVLVGGVNFNVPIIIQNNLATVRRALDGGTSPLAQLNKEYVAAQLNLLVGDGGIASVGVQGSSLRCYGINFAPMPLDNGSTITRNSTIADLLAEARGSISENRMNDMVKLAMVFALLNGNDPTNRCR